MYKSFAPLKQFKLKGSRCSSKVSSRNSSVERIHENKTKINVAIFNKTEEKINEECLETNQKTVANSSKRESKYLSPNVADIKPIEVIPLAKAHSRKVSRVHHCRANKRANISSNLKIDHPPKMKVSHLSRMQTKKSIIDNYYSNSSLNYFDKRNKMSKFEHSIICANSSRGRNRSKKVLATINNSKAEINVIDHEIAVPLDKIVSITSSDILIPMIATDQIAQNTDLEIVEAKTKLAIANNKNFKIEHAKLKEDKDKLNEAENSIVIKKQAESSLLLNKNRERHLDKTKMRSRMKHISFDCSSTINNQKLRKIYESYCLNSNK